MNHPTSNQDRIRNDTARVRRGFTLIELTVSLVITSTLMVAIGASIVVASHAIPDGRETTAATLNVSKAIDNMVEELQYAKTIVVNTATAVEFTVEDRNGDKTDEMIRYEWLGTDGDPLTRQYNGGPLVNVVESIESLDLDYETQTYTKQLPPVVGDEILLSSHVAGDATKKYAINSTNWIGQYFTPDVLPFDTISWSVTRVQFQGITKGQSSGETLVQLRLADDNNLPVSSVLEQQSLLESELFNSAVWVDRQYAAVTGLPTDAGLCLVLEWVSDPESAEVYFDENAGTGLLTYKDGEGWSYGASTSLNYYVYGKATTPGAFVDAYALTRVDIELISGDKTDFAIHASAKILNLPEVTSP